MQKYFEDFDLKNFWKDCSWSKKEVVSKPFDDELLHSIENELGFKLPASYIELMRTQNGGVPIKDCCPTITATSWAEDHVAITGIFGIGREQIYSLCGKLGSTFMIEEWGYPEWGVCICDCPSAGHDMVMLDYRKCGKDGEPEVVHVDQECDYQVTFLAKDFETFIRSLVSDEVYDTSEEDYKRDMENPRR